LAPLLQRWDAALAAWRAAVDAGSAQLVAIANSATAMGHLARPAAAATGAGGARRGLSHAALAAAEASVYQRLQHEYRKLLAATEELTWSAQELEAVAAAVLHLGGVGLSPALAADAAPPTPPPPLTAPAAVTAPTLLTHDAASLGALLAECAAGFRAQQKACADVVVSCAPDAARAASSQALNLCVSFRNDAVSPPFSHFFSNYLQRFLHFFL
jgi:hypothetical protein